MLKVWLPLTGDLHNQGISDVTATGHSVTSVAAGKIGSCYQFTTSAIELNDKIFNNSVTEFTVTAWMKFNNSNSACLFSDRTAINYTGITCFIMDSGDIYFDVGDRWQFTPSTAIPRNQWFHIAFLYKRGVLRQVYLNGALIGSTTSAPAPTSTSTSRSFIGASQNSSTALGGNYFNGWMNDVRIYDHCLSAAEVKEIAQGLVVHYKLDNNGLGNKNLLWGTLVPSTIMYSVISVCGTKHASGQGSTYVSHVRSNRPHGIQCTVGTAARPYIALGHPTASTCLASPDPMWGLTAGQTYTFSGDLEYKVYSGNLELASYFVIRLYYIKSGETAWTNAGNLKTFTTHPGEVHNYHFELPFTIPEDAIGWYILIASNNASASHNAAGDYVAIDNIKLEMGDIATPYAPAPEDFGTALIIEDSSGYNHNGTASDNLLTSTNTPRYSASTHFNGSNTYIACGRGGMVRDAITVNIWGYQDTWSKTPGNMVSCTQSGGWNFENNNSRITFACGTGESANTYKSVYWANHPFSSLASGWHMFTGTYDGYTTKLYVDGDLVASSGTSTEHIPLFYHSSNGIFIGAEANANQTTPTTPYFNGNLSDFRIYCTSLLDTDIKQLYNVGMKIDKKENIHNFETVEDGQNKITKKGQLKCANIIEYLNGQVYRGPQNDPNIYIEPDGSCWIRIFHHNNPASYLFKNTDNFSANVYKDENRWFNFNICNSFSAYEFIARVKRTINDTERVYRWIQNTNPLMATFDQTKVANITKVSGYDSWPLGGLYRLNSSTYLTANNGTNGNWFGATGCWTAWNGGIPGWASTSANDAVTTGYVDIYLRIDPDVRVFSDAPTTVQTTTNNLWLVKQAIER